MTALTKIATESAAPVQASLPTLRILTCGSVDDGKSTLIGRLLHEQQSIHDDQREALARDSKRFGTTGEEIDFALLVDGLEAEREQGITIDVAYRYFATPARAFIVADTPGHEQYTRNMATGASNADLAILLVDARKGLLEQTHRHAAIVSILGIRHVVLAVNKMDLVRYDERVFTRIAADFRAIAKKLRFTDIAAVPISAKRGENVATRSAAMAWYRGPSLIEHLERVDVDDGIGSSPLRFPVQWVNRPHQDFRGFAGTVACGSVRVGDAVVVAGSGRTTRVARIVTMDGDLAQAMAPDSVTLVLADEVDAARGDIISAPENRPDVADQFAARVIWMNDEPLLPGRSYLLKCGGQAVPATVTEIKHKLDVLTFTEIAAKTLGLNEIGFCNFSVSRPVAFDPYEKTHATGAFILIDRETNATAAAGLIEFALRRAKNLAVQEIAVSRETRARLKHQRPAVLWFTGLSGAGKSTIANLVEKKLAERCAHTIMLDGDNVRHGLNRDLGFTEVDRVENIRRIGEVAKLMTDAGLIVLCSFISPFHAERRFVRELLPPGEFVEIFVDTPIDVCIARDVKGLYKRALAGEIKNFTGVDQAYERPENAEITVTNDAPLDDIADRIIDWLVERRFIL